MRNSLRVACVQPSSGQSLKKNLSIVSKMVRDAAGRGAKFIATPENVSLMEHRTDVLKANSYPLYDHNVLITFSSLALETKTTILVGSVPIKGKGEKILNCSVLIDSSGKIIACYSKIHLFDVELVNGDNYMESEVFEPGDKSVIANLPWGKLGMTICYDLRFPYLYRALAKAGAQVITIPAAFTSFTGKDHWHVLVRSRAIECGCYIIAPGMYGEHSGNRSTYGHSLIVDPWGRVLADAGEGTGIIVADIDIDLVSQVRSDLPSLKHDRDISII